MSDHARLIYSLHFETERRPGEPIIEFIVPLDRTGNGGAIVPIGKPRVLLAALAARRECRRTTLHRDD